MQVITITRQLRKTPLFFLLILLMLAPLYSHAKGMGKIVVANRNSGTISIIDSGSDQIIDTVTLPVDVNYPNAPEPMYVVNTPASNRVWVGDRANNRVVVFDGNSFAAETSVPAGVGVFHMWADQAGRQLWVVNDVDNTVTVIDPQSLAIIDTVDMPTDLINDGAKPHDVMLDSQGTNAYVTFLNTSDIDNDTVVQFETVTFQEINRTDVGEDPHISFNRKNTQLYMPCQGSDEIYILNAEDLSLFDTIPFPGTHGAITSTDSKRFYTTNISGSGLEAVAAINTTTDMVIGSADSPDSVPHNLALTPNGKKLYVTHSGAANNTVSVYKTVRNDNPEFLQTIVVGDNPFGLAHVR